MASTAVFPLGRRDLGEPRCTVARRRAICSAVTPQGPRTPSSHVRSRAGTRTSRLPPGRSSARSAWRTRSACCSSPARTSPSSRPTRRCGGSRSTPPLTATCYCAMRASGSTCSTVSVGTTRSPSSGSSVDGRTWPYWVAGRAYRGGGDRRRSGDGSGANMAPRRSSAVPGWWWEHHRSRRWDHEGAPSGSARSRSADRLPLGLAARFRQRPLSRSSLRLDAVASMVPGKSQVARMRVGRARP
jgi:hypothetical protein